MKKLDIFLEKLQYWYEYNKRSLPFRGLKDPYKIWVSEILLQQTQMSRGVEYYQRFVKRFPTVRSLSQVTWSEFLPYFQGLGYYNRGRNMLKAAKVVVNEFKGKFPKTKQELTKIPGIGPYTADAILSFAYNQATLPLDTNIKRVLGRVFLGVPKLDEKSVVAIKLVQRICRDNPRIVSTAITGQAMMDLASAICFATRPNCPECPLNSMCLYFKQEKPHLQKKVKTKKETYDKKYVLAEIYEGKKLLKHKGKLVGGYLAKGDERTYLKKLARGKMGLIISVRPAYRTWVEKGVKYSVHRCYVLDCLER